MFRNTVKTTILLAGLGGLLVAIGSLFGTIGAVIGALLGLALVGGSYWKSDTLAIRAARAVPADEAHMPEYFAVMRDLSDRAGIPMPRLYVSPEPQPNAFATGRNPEHAAVAGAPGLLAVSARVEGRGGLPHEPGRRRNPLARKVSTAWRHSSTATGVARRAVQTRLRTSPRPPCSARSSTAPISSSIH